jgi:hypothetical protein
MFVLEIEYLSQLANVQQELMMMAQPQYAKIVQ